MQWRDAGTHLGGAAGARGVWRRAVLLGLLLRQKQPVDGACNGMRQVLPLLLSLRRWCAV